MRTRPVQRRHYGGRVRGTDIGPISITGRSLPHKESLFFGFTNNTGQMIAQLGLTFNYEKYRSGPRAWDFNLFTSSTEAAENWTPFRPAT
jgi:hypothetical protein